MEKHLKKQKNTHVCNSKLIQILSTKIKKIVKSDLSILPSVNKINFYRQLRKTL
jgi:hypothetical protein